MKPSFWSKNDSEKWSIFFFYFEILLAPSDLPAYLLFFQLELNYGVRTSPIQFCLWLFLSSLHVINVYCEIIGYYYYFQEESSDLVSLISSFLQIVLFLSCFTCHFFSESQSDYQSPTEGQGNLFWGIEKLICPTNSLEGPWQHSH